VLYSRDSATWGTSHRHAMLRMATGRIERAEMTGVQVEEDGDATVRHVTIAHVAVGIRVDSSHRPLFETARSAPHTGGDGSRATGGPTIRESRFADSGEPEYSWIGTVRPSSRTV